MFTKFKIKFFPNRIIKGLHKDVQKKAFFLQEYRLMLQRMWRGEFVKAKKKELREEIRREYDKTNEDLEALKIGQEKNNVLPEPDKTVKENYEKAIESKSKDISQLKEQIESLDKEVLDVNQLLDGYQDGLELLKQFINE